MNEPTNWCCFDSISINLSQLIVDFISHQTINLWLSVSEWKRKKEKVRFENHHQINQNQSINHKSTRNQSSKKWNEINLIFMSDLFPISNQSIKSTNHHWEWVICLFVWLFFVSIVSHLNWCLICFACWNQFNFPFIQSIKFDDDDEFQLIVTTNKSTNNPSHCHSLACFNFHLLQNTNQIKLARGQSQSIQSFLIHLNQFNVTINQSNQNQMKRIHSFFHWFLSSSLNQSNFSFPTHPSSMYLFCQSINQLTINQITLSQLTHKSKSIHKSTN